MLGLILPGLRDIRSSLAVGVVWLIAGWVIAYEQQPGIIDKPDGFMVPLVDLAHRIGSVAVVGLLIFGSYVLGGISVWATSGAYSWLRDFSRDLLTASSPSTRARRRSGDPRVRVTQIQRERSREFGHLVESPDAWHESLTAVSEDFRFFESRLQVSQPALYERYDRLTAEGELKIGLAVPLCAASVAAQLVYSDTWWWMVGGLTLALIVGLHGHKCVKDGEWLLVDALEEGFIDFKDALSVAPEQVRRLLLPGESTGDLETYRGAAPSWEIRRAAQEALSDVTT